MAQTKRKKEMGKVTVGLDNIFGSGAPRERPPAFKDGNKVVTPKTPRSGSCNKTTRTAVSA